MKDRIEGWTQEDEDKTFGLNGHGREWTGEDPPPLEAQRLLKKLRAALAQHLDEACPVRKRPPPLTAAAFRAAIDDLNKEAEAAGWPVPDAALSAAIKVIE